MEGINACKAKDVDVDQVRFGLSNDWKAQVPEGLDPCLPEGVLKVLQLATQGVRVTKSAAKAAQVSLRVAPPQVAALEEEAAPEGSNSWEVGPSKAATGRPIMANDPHRAYSAPSLRYIVHLSAPGLDVIGAGEPALPGISLGHNGAIAFGLTIFNIDQEDCSPRSRPRTRRRNARSPSCAAGMPGCIPSPHRPRSRRPGSCAT